MSIRDRIARRIAAEGAISVAEYMAECNAHYYATRDPLGAPGDFTTAPEISQIFGEIVGAWLAEMWRGLGSPRACLTELGPGRGTLMADLLRATRGVAGFHDALDLVLVETSPVLRALQEKMLSGFPRIRWQESIRPLPELPLLLVANEFFDALPVRQTLENGEERRIGLEGVRLVFQPEGKVVHESSPKSQLLMRAIASHIHDYGGAALVIDYGYKSGGGDTLQAVRGHEYADPLGSPGEVDLTAHVDFTALARAAFAANAQVRRPVTQGDFLNRLGAPLRAEVLCRADESKRPEILAGLERLTAPAAMGTLFRVLAVTSSLAKPPGF